MRKILGQVFKGVAGRYQVYANGHIFDDISARKKLRYSKLFVGDYVEFDEAQRVIDSVVERRNSIVRPPLANIDKMFIVVAPVPTPDFMLVDKLIVQCVQNNIEPLLVVNKVDIASKEFLDSVVRQYNQAVKIFKCTTLKNDGFDILKDELKGQLSIFVGQSAVGKSSIINVLLPNAFREIGSLSAKTNRGKNCTRESQIYVLENGGKIADTTGFSALELKDISKEQLSDCYAEIKKYSIDCDYNTCNHIGESEKICAVKRAVREGKINKQRFSRYTQLYNEIKEWEEKRYG